MVYRGISLIERVTRLVVYMGNQAGIQRSRLVDRGTVLTSSEGIQGW